MKTHDEAKQVTALYGDKAGRPSTFIQWKGTDVCMDCYCLCGKQFHIDAAFAYNVVCPYCKRQFVVGTCVSLIEYDPATHSGCDAVKSIDEQE